MTPDDALLVAFEDWRAAKWPQAARTARDQAQTLATLFLSPIGRQVVDHLASRDGDRAAGIARAVSRTAPSTLRAMLKDLIDRGILTHNGIGYELAPAVKPLLPLIRDRA